MREKRSQEVYGGTLDTGGIQSEDTGPTINSCGKETASPVISVAGEVFLCGYARTKDSDKVIGSCRNGLSERFVLKGSNLQGKAAAGIRFRQIEVIGSCRNPS